MTTTPTGREAVEQTIADMEKIGHTEPIDLVRALADERDAAVARAEAAEAEVRRLQEAGQAVLLARDWHHHEPSADDVDTCRVCGRDVRHPVHLGEGPRDLVERDAVENLRAALGEGGE